MRQLLANGVDPHMPDQWGRTSLHIAAEIGSKEAVEILLTVLDDISAIDDQSRTTMDIAIGANHPPIVELLFKKDPVGANRCAENMTALQIATILGREEIAKVILTLGVHVDAKDQFGWTALHRASRAGVVAVGRLLLGNGADIHAMTEQLSMPVHCAAENAKDDMLRFLI